MSDINRFSHVVMNGSPVIAPFGLTWIKQQALKLFGGELNENHQVSLTPGRSLDLLPSTGLPKDMVWASSNPRIANALARWAVVMTEEGNKVIPTDVKKLIHQRLESWDNELVPLSGSWVEEEVKSLNENDKPIARLALLLAKASYQIDDEIVFEVLGENNDQERLIRVLAWSSFTSARYAAKRMARIASESKLSLRQVA